MIPPIDLSTVPPLGTHSEAKFWLDVADKAIKALAIAVGAAWTFLNYRRGRTFTKRLEPEVSGRLFAKDGRYFLIVVCRAKNVGLSKIPLQHRGSACEVFALTEQDMHPSENSDSQNIFPVFEEHDWIEPGEQICHPEVIAVDFYSPELVGIRMNLRLVSQGVDWAASCIAEIPPESNEADKSGGEPKVT